MATLADALKLVEKDPPIGYVSIPIVASQPPAKAIIIVLKGQRLQLPDWTAKEWLWWGNIAPAVAAAQPAKNDVGAKDKARALGRLAPLLAAMTEFAALHPNESPPLPMVGPFYDAAVRVVIASNAAAFGPTAGRLAAEAIGSAFLAAPATVKDFVVARLSEAADLFLKDLPKAGAKLLANLFDRAAGGLFGLTSGQLLVGLGLVGAWYLTRNTRSSGHGEEA